MRYLQLSKSDEKTHQKRCHCQTKATERIQTPLHPLLQFQQTIGNRAVRRLIQARVKTKQPSDVYEQEADRTAGQVMRMRGPKISYRTSTGDAVRGRIQRVCSECEETRHREEKKEKGAQPESLSHQTVHRQTDEEREEEPAKAKSASPDAQEIQERKEDESISRSEAIEAKEKGEDRDDEFKIKGKPAITFSVVESDQPLPNGVEGKRQACPAAAAAPQRHRSLDSTAAQIASMGACTWGITAPDNLGISTQTCRAGPNWRLVVTQVNSVIRMHSRLLAGQREPVPDVNTTAGNFCNQVTELDTLGVCPGAWYMIRAVHAHENVHIQEWLNNFTADWNPLETAIEGLTVPAAGATASRAAATAALRADPVFVNARDTSNAGGNFPTFWGIPDPNANTNAAETAVVTPRIQWICKTAGWRGWGPAGCPVCVAQGIT